MVILARNLRLLSQFGSANNGFVLVSVLSVMSTLITASVYWVYIFLFIFFFRCSESLRFFHHRSSQRTMAGFRQEDVELYYEMGEELGRYVV